MPSQLLLLAYQVRRLLVIHVSEHRIEPRLRPGLGPLHRTQDGDALLVLDRRRGIIVHPSRALQEAIETHERVRHVRCPADLVGVAVTRRVVRSRVVTASVSHRLDHHGRG